MSNDAAPRNSSVGLGAPQPQNVQEATHSDWVSNTTCTTPGHLREDCVVGARRDPYYRRDLALVHHRGFGFHAQACAPGILALLEPVLARDGLVLEIGCGSGLLTRALVDAGHRVIATDASPAMLDVARDFLGADAPELRRIALPDDALPGADAIVGIGHPLNYLPDADAIDRAIVAMAQALRPAGVLAFDICDLSWGAVRRGAIPQGRVGPDWAIITEFSVPAPDRFVRELTTFLPNGDGSWRRDFERHENVLIDTGQLPARLETLGISARVGDAFGDERHPEGLHAVWGVRGSD